MIGSRGNWHRICLMASPRNSVRIFIVEDNDPDVFLVREALRSHGISPEIQHCRDGEEAIRALSQIGQAGLPDVIIVDLNLPKLSGLSLTGC